VDGHDVKSICNILEIAREHSGPILLHLRTVKGKGYDPAEFNPEKYHGVREFHVPTGQPVDAPRQSFSGVFGEKLAQLAQKDGRITAITAAMQSGAGLDGFASAHPDRFFDVGIAEEHAVTMAAGMAIAGLVPVFAVYSTFLQRCYDMIAHDVALQKLHVVFAVDRAGLVGEDGATHQGIYDMGFLCQIPGVTVLCPASFAELEHMLEQAVNSLSGPVAIRYPRGEEGLYTGLSSGPCEKLAAGADFTLCAYGIMINEVLKAASRLKSAGYTCDIIKLNALSGDMAEIRRELEASAAKTGRLLIAEDCLDKCSAGRLIVSGLAESGPLPTIRLINIKAESVCHGSVENLMEKYEISSDAIYAEALEIMNNE
jgi:1-deoxy-D-xylulose-5-phosphate synthase